jgi:hypothetical protein
MAAHKTHHVVPDPKGGWTVRRGGSEKASKHFEDKKDAISWGKQVSQKNRTEFVIHRRDGTIEKKDSHGRDPLPPRDRR